jgi:hypothetical protein
MEDPSPIDKAIGYQLSQELSLIVLQHLLYNRGCPKLERKKKKTIVFVS